MKRNYVYSTLTCDNLYTSYTKPETTIVNGKEVKLHSLPIVETQILIKGGANVAPSGFRRLETPLGVVTEVTDQELKLLEDNEVFQLHKKNGHITVIPKKVHPEVVAADMNTRDESAPLTPADMAKPEPKEEKKDKPTGRFDKKTVKNDIK